MGKRIKIIALALLMAAASLYGGYLVRQARQRELFCTVLAQQPIGTVQAIAPDQLQFTVKASYFDGSGYVDCVLASPERAQFYAAGNIVQAADAELERAVRAVTASLGNYAYDWSVERPTVTPGKSYPSLSFFEGAEMAAKESFTIDGTVLRWSCQVEGGWLVCTYSVDQEALQTLTDAVHAVYLNRNAP